MGPGEFGAGMVTMTDPMTKPLEMKPIDEPNTWVAAELPGRAGWAHRLSPEMIAEITLAMRSAIEAGLSTAEITDKTFLLPVTSAVLDKVYDDLENGRGFAVLEGWPVDEFSYAENVAAYAGVSANLGRIAVQNYEGERVVDVRDDGVPYSHASRGYKSNKHLPFHTDGGDMTALLCLGEAASGGKSVLVSATKAFNVIREERPEFLETLERGFYHHRRRQHAPGENPLSAKRIPVFAFHNGFLHCCYNRNPIDWVEKEGMELTAHEKEVLDFFDSVTGRPEMQIEVDIRKGDMQFLNNFVLLHSRTAFKDGPGTKRHMVRLWLQAPNSKRMGEGLLDLYVPGTSRYHAST